MPISVLNKVSVLDPNLSHLNPTHKYRIFQCSNIMHPHSHCISRRLFPSSLCARNVITQTSYICQPISSSVVIISRKEYRQWHSVFSPVNQLSSLGLNTFRSNLFPDILSLCINTPTNYFCDLATFIILYICILSHILISLSLFLASVFVRRQFLKHLIVLLTLVTF
jgi:hypothetical protein